MIGPFAIVVWIIGEAIAMVLAMVFGYCSYYGPNVGGSFAYVSEAFDDFYGFIAGWSMCIAEIIALPVFAIVFTNYLEYFIPLPFGAELGVRVVFIAVLVTVNIVGVKAAGRLNDVLTLAKLTPLLLIILLGVGSILLTPRLLGNYAPLAPVGLDNFGTVLVLIFWAYAGFELGTLPASEVVNPKKNLPRAMISGMAIPIDLYFSKKTDIRKLRGELREEEAVLVRNLQRQNKSLANTIRLVSAAYRRIRGKRGNR
jgi:amino acid transporter